MLLGSVALSVAACGPALAADGPPRPAATKEQPSLYQPYDIVLEIGGGGGIKPAYEGAKDYAFSPMVVVALHYLRLPSYGVVKDSRIKNEGFSIGPSFRFVSERVSADHTQLRGLNDVDSSFELGGKFSYTFGMFRPFVAVRYGFGHEGIVGEAGLDVIMRPMNAVEVTIGPRASFASSEYMRAYFGVTPVESVRSGLATFTPGSGLKSAGAELGVRYEYTPEWTLIGTVAYERLIGDAADSPIVARGGEENQFTAKIGVSYKFGLKLFN
jgi:outer membrane scaffolding protein for murein synthesis (MipA/OmpV family)